LAKSTDGVGWLAFALLIFGVRGVFSIYGIFNVGIWEESFRKLIFLSFLIFDCEYDCIAVAARLISVIPFSDYILGKLGLLRVRCGDPVACT